MAEVTVRPIQASEEARYQELMQSHHYLGALPKIGNTLWYVATWEGEWLALLSFSAAALKCGVRDRWIGWDYRHQYDRLSWSSECLCSPNRRNPGSRSPSLDGWQGRVKSAVLHAIALAHYAIVCARAWAADSISARAHNCLTPSIL